MSIHRRKTKDGQTRYLVRFYESGRSGARRQATFDSLRDARLFEASMRRAAQLGQLASEVVGSEQMVEDFIIEWWEKYATAGGLSAGSRATYAPVLDKWILPYLGGLRLRDVSREAIDRYRATLVRAGAEAPTVNRALGIVQGIFERAVEWRRLPANPVRGVKRVQHVRDDAIDAREPETVEAIRAQLGRQDAALVSVLAYEGLRPAEAFALEWRDVLDDRGRPRERLRVQRALSDGQVSTTKSARAREPELFAPVARELAELYLWRGRPDRRELVFRDARGGHLLRQNWRRRAWLPALRRAGVDYFRPYDLRHTCATLLVYEGRTVNEVAEQLGHSDPGFTARTYAHVYRDARKRRGVTIEDAIASARGRTVDARAGS